MKKHLSVPGLLARSTLCPILALLALMGAAEMILFRRALANALTAYGAGVGDGFPQLERLLSRCGAPVCFGVAALLITVLLCLPGCEFRTRTSYTLRRLSVGNRALFVWQLAYNTLIYLLLVTTQAAVARGLCAIYLTAAPAEVIGEQTLFLAFWRSEHLHALFPMADVALWLRNLFLLLSMALSAAIFPLKQREGRYSGSVIAMSVFAVFSFDRGIADVAHAVIAFVVLCMVLCELLGFALIRNDEDDSDNDDDNGEVAEHA